MRKSWIYIYLPFRFAQDIIAKFTILFFSYVFQKYRFDFLIFIKTYWINLNTPHHYQEYSKYKLCLLNKVKLFVKRLVYMYTITLENNITTKLFLHLFLNFFIRVTKKQSIQRVIHVLQKSLRFSYVSSFFFLWELKDFGNISTKA